MHRYTPRTCLWPLTGALICTFALSIGLTFRSDHACFAGVCGEWLFPLQARLHVIVWYSWLSISVTILALRAFQPSIAKLMQTSVLQGKLPILGKELHICGALIVLWIAILYASVTGIWWRHLDSYFETRGQTDGIVSGNHLLAAIALTGHYGDITMGMALVPVSRHSALASFFKLSVSSTLTFHMLTAYTLFTIVLVHGLLYVAWLPTLPTLNLHVKQAYPILEPTYHVDEVYPGNTSSLGIWRASLIFTGAASALIMVVIFITTLPKIRFRHFNWFYFTHLTTILAVVIVCLHASTMFYCTAPGLAMIVLDWGMRLYDLKEDLGAQVVHLGKGWYTLSVDLPRHRLKGCACKSPLAHFYIQHGASSIRELHPFTTTTHLATQDSVLSSQTTSIPIQFLFRKSRAAVKSGRSNSVETIEEDKKHMHPLRRISNLVHLCFAAKKADSPKMQWTEKLATVADAGSEVDIQSKKTYNFIDSASLKHVSTRIRFEGPYFTPATPQAYETVVCIVAGTGISGALAIAAAFANRWDSSAVLSNSEAPSNTFAALELDDDAATTQKPYDATRWQRLVICWSVRAEDYIDLPFVSVHNQVGLELRPYLTGPGRSRMDIAGIIQELKKDSTSQSADSQHSPRRKTWAYISGPKNFINAAEIVCREQEIDYYGARWDI